jgi:hypothetical protein
MKTLYHFQPKFPLESRKNKRSEQKYLDKKAKEKDNFFGEQDNHDEDDAYANYKREYAREQNEKKTG